MQHRKGIKFGNQERISRVLLSTVRDHQVLALGTKGDFEKGVRLSSGLFTFVTELEMQRRFCTYVRIASPAFSRRANPSTFLLQREI